MGGNKSRTRAEIDREAKQAGYSKKLRFEKLPFKKSDVQYLLGKEIKDVTELTIHGGDFEQSWLELFKTAKWKLEELYLSNNYMGSSLGKYLKSANLEGLRVLDLTDNLLFVEGARELASVPFKKLSSLDLFGNNIRDDGFAALTAHSFILRRLNAGNNGITAVGCLGISQANWQNLVYLNIRVNCIGSKGCKYLKASKLGKIEYLNMEYCNVQNEGCRWLAKAHWTELKNLFLEGNHITNDGCRYLRRASCKRLTHLNLVQNQITSQGARQFYWTKLPFLGSVSLDYNDVSDFLCRSMKTGLDPTGRLVGASYFG